MDKTLSIVWIWPYWTDISDAEFEHDSSRDHAHAYFKTSVYSVFCGLTQISTNQVRACWKAYEAIKQQHRRYGTRGNGLVLYRNYSFPAPHRHSFNSSCVVRFGAFRTFRPRLQFSLMTPFYGDKTAYVIDRYVEQVDINCGECYHPVVDQSFGGSTNN